jgi:hypothetical protein
VNTEPTLPFPSAERPEDMPPSDPWGQPLPPPAHPLPEEEEPPVSGPPAHTPPPAGYAPPEPSPAYPPPGYAPPESPPAYAPPPSAHTPPSGYPPPPVSAAPYGGSPVSAAPYGGSPVSAPPQSGYAHPVAAPPGYSPSTPGGSAPFPADPGRVVARIGEITVTTTQVRTPTGVIPLAGSSWQVTEHWQTERETPGWAILAAVLGFLVLTIFSLLFLLVKRPVQQGTAQVTVTNGPHRYTARLPVADHAQLQNVQSQVTYVRSLAGAH